MDHSRIRSKTAPLSFENRLVWMGPEQYSWLSTSSPLWTNLKIVLGATKYQVLRFWIGWWPCHDLSRGVKLLTFECPISLRDNFLVTLSPTPGSVFQHSLGGFCYSSGSNGPMEQLRERIWNGTSPYWNVIAYLLIIFTKWSKILFLSMVAIGIKSTHDSTDKAVC